MAGSAVPRPGPPDPNGRTPGRPHGTDDQPGTNPRESRWETRTSVGRRKRTDRAALIAVALVDTTVPPRPFDPLADRVRASLAPLVTFAGVLSAGLVGFVLLAGVTPIEAAFWLLDPTSIELHFATHDGPATATKAYALAVFAGLLVAGLWIGESVADTVFGGRVGEELRRARARRAARRAEDHVIVCGYGTFGRTVARRLRETGRSVVVVDSDPATVEAAADGVCAIEGDARTEETLRAAGIERARALVAGIDDADANLQICMVADQLAPESRLIVRVGDDEAASLARRAGADSVVIPEAVSGARVVDEL